MIQHMYCCTCGGFINPGTANLSGQCHICASRSHRLTFQNPNPPADQTNPKDLVGIKKPRLSLVPPSSIIYEALAMEDGAAKYGPYNWREKKVVASIYVDACLRHLAQWFDGEECAKDSKKPHLAHAKACLGIIIDALETGNLVDDRPKPGAAPKLISTWTKGE